MNKDNCQLKSSRVCDHCGKPYKDKKHKFSRSKKHYCSIECSKKSTLATVECKLCKKIVSGPQWYWGKNKHRQFCSIQCSNIYRSGDRHPNWKNGITSQNILVRGSTDYRRWRRKVLIRDDHTCQRCGRKNITFIAHHVKSFSEYKKLWFVLENGLTVCRSCHNKIHKHWEKRWGKNAKSS